MSKYKVWIEIEEVDEDGEHVEDYDPGFGVTKEFDSLEEATRYATALHNMIVWMPDHLRS